MNHIFKQQFLIIVYSKELKMAMLLLFDKDLIE